MISNHPFILLDQSSSRHSISKVIQILFFPAVSTSFSWESMVLLNHCWIVLTDRRTWNDSPRRRPSQIHWPPLLASFSTEEHSDECCDALVSWYLNVERQSYFFSWCQDVFNAISIPPAQRSNLWPYDHKSASLMFSHWRHFLYSHFSHLKAAGLCISNRNDVVLYNTIITHTISSVVDYHSPVNIELVIWSRMSAAVLYTENSSHSLELSANNSIWPVHSFFFLWCFYLKYWVTRAIPLIGIEWQIYSMTKVNEKANST